MNSLIKQEKISIPIEDVFKVLRQYYDLPKGKLTANKDHWHNRLVIQKAKED